MNIIYFPSHRKTLQYKLSWKNFKFFSPRILKYFSIFYTMKGDIIIALTLKLSLFVLPSISFLLFFPRFFSKISRNWIIRSKIFRENRMAQWVVTFISERQEGNSIAGRGGAQNQNDIYDSHMLLPSGNSTGRIFGPKSQWSEWYQSWWSLIERKISKIKFLFFLSTDR